MTILTIQDQAREIFADAHLLHSQAVERLEAGDIRDGAEKAWCATKRATDALILARTGVKIEHSPDTTRGLNELVKADRAVRSLHGRYYHRQGLLRGSCFYLGSCDPEEEIVRLVRETADYIKDAEGLALF